MHDSVAICFTLAALASGCGSDRDLVIGRNDLAFAVHGDARGIDPIEASPCPVDDIPPPASLVHRYSFDGTGTVVNDSAGSADGTILAGGMLDGSGSLTLDGNNDYVNLPNGLISQLTDVTLVAWISERGGSGFERVFDFGNSTAGEDQRGKGKSFVMLTPFSGSGDGRDLTMQAGTPALGVIQIATDRSIRDGAVHQVAVVFRSGTRAELYLDSQLLGTRATAMKLSDIEDVNDWLGQSQFLPDNNFGGTYTEFRIYRQALSACALEATLTAGPDSLP